MGCVWGCSALLSCGSSCREKTAGLLPALSARRECHPALAVTEWSLSCPPVCTGSLFGASELLEPVPCKQSSPERCSRQILVRGMQVLAGLLGRDQVVCVLEHCSTFLPGKPLGKREGVWIHHKCHIQPGCVGSSVSFPTSGTKISVGWPRGAGCLWRGLLRLLCAGL